MGLAELTGISRDQADNGEALYIPNDKHLEQFVFISWRG